MTKDTYNPFVALSEQISHLSQKIDILGEKVTKVPESSESGQQSLDRFISEIEAAEKLGVSRGTLFKLRKRGILSGYKVAGSLKYRLSEILDTPRKIQPSFDVRHD